MREDVLRNLSEMLRTRLGSAPSSVGYGLPDLTDLVRAGAEIGAMVGRALKRAIETFEPRLANVRVVHTPGEHWDHLLRFEVSAQLVNERSRQPLVFETRIDPSRRVIIR